MAYATREKMENTFFKLVDATNFGAYGDGLIKSYKRVFFFFFKKKYSLNNIYLTFDVILFSFKIWLSFFLKFKITN